MSRETYGNYWMMLRVNVLRHPRGHLWRGIAASGPLHPQTDLYIVDYCKCTHIFVIIYLYVITFLIILIMMV